MNSTNVATRTYRGVRIGGRAFQFRMKRPSGWKGDLLSAASQVLILIFLVLVTVFVIFFFFGAASGYTMNNAIVALTGLTMLVGVLVAETSRYNFFEIARNQSSDEIQIEISEGKVKVGGTEVKSTPNISGAYWLYVKRVIDFIISANALIFLAPLLLAVAIALKIESRGPIFVWNERFDVTGAPILVRRFRTNLEGQTSSNLGVFLRRTSIDYLPTIIDVLMGSFSLVGYRPYVSQPKLSPSVLEVARNFRPGMVSLAGSFGISRKGWVGEGDPALELDVFYFQNWSLMMDVSIIFRTLRSEFFEQWR